jgi:hypothetical protein
VAVKIIIEYLYCLLPDRALRFRLLAPHGIGYRSIAATLYAPMPREAAANGFNVKRYAHAWDAGSVEEWDLPRNATNKLVPCQGKIITALKIS